MGPLAGTVSDAWAIYNVLAGGATPPSSSRSIDSLRLGKVGGYFLEALDDDVRARFEEALSRLKDAGASIVDINLGPAEHSGTYVNVALPEAFAYHAEALEKVPRNSVTAPQPAQRWVARFRARPT